MNSRGHIHTAVAVMFARFAGFERGGVGKSQVRVMGGGSVMKR